MTDYRRVARELALRVLYEVDVGRQPARDALSRAIEQLAAGVRAGITMAVKEANSSMKPRSGGPAVFTSQTVLRERDRIRRAVNRAVERIAAGFDPTLIALFAEASRSTAGSAETHALKALDEASTKPLERLELSLASAGLTGEEKAAARRAASEAVAKMRRVLERRLDLGLTTARMVAELVRGALRHRDELDVELGTLTGDWPLDRQSAADRNILRLAAYEIAHRPETPAPVAMNEAVELAKRYGTEESGRFVNGVLAAFASRRAAQGDAGSDEPPPIASTDAQPTNDHDPIELAKRKGSILPSPTFQGEGRGVGLHSDSAEEVSDETA